jgi:hypothetical protein
MFGLQHKKGSYLGFGLFSFLQKKFEGRKAYNMFYLMLDPRFKAFCLVSSFIGLEQGKAIVEEYDKKILFSMLMKCYYHLHPLVEFEGVLLMKGLNRTRVSIFLR